MYLAAQHQPLGRLLDRAKRARDTLFALLRRERQPYLAVPAGRRLADGALDLLQGVEALGAHEHRVTRLHCKHAIQPEDANPLAEMAVAHGVPACAAVD